MHRLLLLGALLAALALVPASGNAGVIKGTVRIGRGVPAQPAASASGRKPAKRPPVRDVVIWVEQIPDKLEKKLAKKAEPVRIGQAYKRFDPPVTPVVVGSTIEFENQDRVYHDVFSVTPGFRFDVGKYAPRESRQVKFAKTGAVKLFCDIDPGETGFLYVVPNHACTQPDSLGRFELPKLQPGKYEVRIWHPSYGRIKRDVEMPKRGDVALDLQL